MNQIELGKKIREARQKVGMSQEQLSDQTGLNLRTIQRIETGETAPRGDSMTRIASALATSMEELSPANPPKENKGKLMLMITSQFACLWSPVLGLLFPLMIWLFYKDKVKGMYKTGKLVLILQLIWCLIYAGVYAWLNQYPTDTETRDIIFQVLYCLNLIIIVAEGVWVGVRSGVLSAKETPLVKEG